MAHRGTTAVVIGSGMAGLCAARVLSEFFDEIIVLENDSDAENLSARPGTPQARHLHVLLAGGLEALEFLFPGLTPSLIASGAQSLNVSEDYWLERPGFGIFPRRHLGIQTLSMTRPLLEREVRKRIGKVANVEVQSGRRAVRCIPAKDGTSMKGVSVSTKNGALEVVDADFIVDASGSGQLTLDLIDTLGLQHPPEAHIGIDMHYATATFPAPPSIAEDWKLLVTYPHLPENRRGAFLIPVENGQWMATLIGRHDCKPPGDVTGFLEYAKQVRTPTAFNFLQQMNIRPEIARYGLQASRRRHFEQVIGFPAGLLPIGDSICRFNPVYGQGMTVAAKEACLLQNILASNVDGARAATGEFLLKSQHLIDVPWTTAAVPDFLDPLTEGQRPDGLKEALAFQSGLFRLAEQDAEVHKLMVEVQHMVRPRQDLLQPDILERISTIAKG